MLGGPAAVAGSSHLVLVVLVAGVHGLLTVLILIVLPQMPDFRDIRVPEMRWMPPVAGAGVLLGLTVSSHAWGSGAPAVLADWAHMTAAAVWIGGLACLLVVLTGMPPPDRARASPALVPRMSTAAAAALGLLVATGLYGAWLHVPGLAGLVASGYGRALLVKLALFVPLVLLGAFNRFVLRPQLAAAHHGARERAQLAPTHRGASERPRVAAAHHGVSERPQPSAASTSGDMPVPVAAAAAGAPAHRRLLKTVGGEASLGAVVLLVVAVLTAIPPARVTLGISPATNLWLAGFAGDVRLSLMVEPVLPGPNEIEVTVLAGDGRPIEADARVMVRLTRLDEDLVPSTLVLESRGQGRYSAAGGAVIPGGWWEAVVVLRRRGRLDVSTAFPLRIGRPRAAASDPGALRLLEASRAAMSNLRAWREEEQITDGAGGTVIVEADLVRPDRLRYRTSGGDEGIIIGADRYRRIGAGAWERDTLPKPLAADGVLQYMRGAEAVVLGRGAYCEAEACRVVLWEAPGRTAAFAAWVGVESRRIHRLMMVAQSHFMTSRVFGFDAPVRIDPPR
jgi:putative copper export protein